MSYKHGIYGTVAVTNSNTDTAQGTIPAYIGSAPVHRVNTYGSSDFNYAEYLNKPILVSSLREAQALGLYSDDWEAYTLCEAIHAHFMNGEQPIAPIILINTMNPDSDIEESAGTATVTMKKVGTGFLGYIEDPLCSLKGIALTVNAEAGVENQTFAYYYDGDRVAIEAKVTFSNGKENTASFTVDATYTKIAYSAEKFTKEAVEKALSGLDYCEQITGYIPNIIAAPGLSEKPEFHALMIQKIVDKINGKWNAICVSDIPSSAKTYAEAKAWKATNVYESKYDKVCWPALAYGDKIYHASTVAAYMMQNIDSQNNDVPYASISNKEVFCDRAVVGDGETLMINEVDANDLNQVGITTVNIIKRKLRLWGAHMANYSYANLSSVQPEDRFDTSVRMMMYILNYLQNQYINEIDQSFTRKDIDSVVNGIQTWFDSLVNDGMLLYATISFNNESNSDADIANGDFVFDMQVTYNVIAKSITFKLQYTSAGLVALTNEGGSE